jgi:Yip1-like protein
MNAAARAKAILVDPAMAWQRIEKDIGDPAFLLSRYVAVLALIPALSGFIGATLIGAIAPSGAIVRADLVDGLLGAIFNYAASCAIVLLLAVTMNLLAPLFGGRRDFEDAFKLAVYSFTPLWLAGLCLLLPGLRFLLLIGVYGVYLLWLGVPRLAKVPEQHAGNFTMVIVVCACGLLYAAALAQRILFGTAGL